MRTVLLASLRTHTRRYGAALLAIVVGVVFILVTAALSSAVRSGLTAGLAQPYDGADAVVDKPTTDQAVRLLDAAPAAGADAWLIGWAVQQVSHDGAIVDADADIGHVPDQPRHRWQELLQGRFPAHTGEAVVDTNAAKVGGITVGDRLRVGSGRLALSVEVVGLVDSPSTFSVASVYLSWPDLARWQDRLYVSSIAWAGGSGYDEARAAIREVVPQVEPVTVDAFVQDMQQEVNNGVDLVAIVVLFFAAVALLVSALVINNTFTILFAQRSRDFALLRCVGATRRQVVRSVRLESLALGVLAAVAGIGAGLAAGHGLVALIRDRWPEARLGAADVGLGWVAVAASVAVVVTLVAAWLPTRRVVQVSPLAALRPDDSTRISTATGRVRLALGVLLVGLGVAAIAAAVGTASPPALVAGGSCSFLGVLLLGPVLVPSLIRAVGRGTGRLLGPAGRLAAGNAVRHPRRTAATTASLLIGVTLTTAVLTGLASSRSALASEMNDQHPIDIALTSARPVPADVVAQVESVDGVASVTTVPGVTAKATDIGPLTVLAAPSREGVGTVLHGDLPAPGAGEIVLPWNLLGNGVAEGDRLSVTVGGHTRRLAVVGGEGWGEAALVAPATLDRLAAPDAVRAVWVRAEDGADAEDLAGSLEALGAPLDAETENGLARRAYVDLQLDVLAAGVVGLLAIAVVIALVGIANTLGLSVLERAREHALLRALGLARRQVRRMLAVEAVLLSVVATVLGTALGVAFAWAGVRALVEPVVADAGLVLPWWQLAVVVATAALAGLVAAVVPSRRAARVAPAAGLAVE